MITRFDHAVIAVRDVERAIQVYRDGLGLDARPGGRHTGRGTHNALVRFGLDYLELIGVADRAELEAAAPRGAAPFLEVLARGEGGLLAYCLAADPLDDLVDGVNRSDLVPTDPFPMRRRRPDGTLLTWRLLVPDGNAWRRPWPFMIQWDTPDEQRLAWEPPGRHPLGATGVAGVAVVVQDLVAVRDLYERGLGLAFAGEDDLPELAARRARYRLGGSAIDLLAPSGPGPVRQALDADGEGLFEVRLRVESLDQARAHLRRSGVVVTPSPGTPGGLLIDPARALGARLVLAPASR